MTHIISEEVINGIVFQLEHLSEEDRCEPHEKYCLSMRNSGAEEDNWYEHAFAETKEELTNDYIEVERNKPKNKYTETLIKLRECEANKEDKPLRVLRSKNKPREYNLTRLEKDDLKDLGFEMITLRWGVARCALKPSRMFLTCPSTLHGKDAEMINTGVYLAHKEKRRHRV